MRCGVLLVVALFAGACGSTAEQTARSAPAAKETKAPESTCSTSNPAVTARDLVSPPPPGLRVVPLGKPQYLRRFAGLVDEHVDAIRAWDASDVRRRGAQDRDAATFIVVNAFETRAERVVANLPELGLGPTRRITIAGRKGRMESFGPSAFIVAPAGDCAVMIVITMSRRGTRDALAALR